MNLEEIMARNPYDHYAPLSDAIPDHIEWARRPEQRVYTGIEQLDRAMRGTAPGELTEIVAFAQAGKTQFTINLLLAQPNKHVLYYTPDESRELVLVKLACAKHGISAERLEYLLQEGDEYAEHVLEDTAEAFERLAVFDDLWSLDGLDKGFDEAVEAWGHHQPDLAIFDYLDLLDCGEEANARATALKGWAKRRRVPLFVLHQSSRTAGKDGQEVTITSATHGGERQATHMIGIRRKVHEYAAQVRELEAKLRSPTTRDPQGLHEMLALAKSNASIHASTVTVSLLKNKRPPGRLVPEIDYELEADTGRLIPLDDGELPRQYRQQQEPKQTEMF